MTRIVEDRIGLAAVLFDMDGTLIDSEPLWDQAMQALAARHGGVLSEAGRLGMVGRNSADSMAVFYQDLGLTQVDPVADAQFIAGQIAALFRTDLRWRPGAAELVAEVRAAGLPTALVTSTNRALVEVALESTLGRDTFDVVICGNEVTSPKPHPESYLTAAAVLGVSIDQCVAIEDSPTGVASATAAGAVVLGVAGELALTPGDGARLVDTLTRVDLAYLSGLVPRR